MFFLHCYDDYNHNQVGKAHLQIPAHETIPINWTKERKHLWDKQARG